MWAQCRPNVGPMSVQRWTNVGKLAILCLRTSLSSLLTHYQHVMDKRTDRRTDRETDGQTNGQRDRRTDRETDGQTNGQRDRRTDERTERQTDRRMDILSWHRWHLCRTLQGEKFMARGSSPEGHPHNPKYVGYSNNFYYWEVFKYQHRHCLSTAVFLVPHNLPKHIVLRLTISHSTRLASICQLLMFVCDFYSYRELVWWCTYQKKFERSQKYEWWRDVSLYSLWQTVYNETIFNRSQQKTHWRTLVFL